MRFSVRVLLCALSVACVACRDVPQAPIEPPPPAPSAFTVLLINTQFNVDYGPGFQQATLFADPGGEIDAVYEDFDDGTLRYSGCPVSCGDVRYWRSGVADSGAGFLYVAGYASAALDGSGLHALYEGVAGVRHSLLYGSCPGLCISPAHWSRAVIDSSGDAGMGVALTASSSGALHAVYSVRTPVGVDTVATTDYATCATLCADPVNWQKTVIAPGATRESASESAIRSEASGRLHIALLKGDTLRYATCAGGCTNPAQWAFVTLDVAADFPHGEPPSLALLPGGGAALAYWGRDSLKVASCAAGCADPAAWQRGVIAFVPGHGFGSGLVADAGGGLHLAYALYFLVDSASHLTAIGGVIKYASCISGCTAPAAWQAVTVDSGPQYYGSGYPALALDQSNRAHIVFAAYGAFYYAQQR